MEKVYLTSKDIIPDYEMYYGFESHIYEFDSYNLMKIFKTDDEQTLKNKLQKILLLSELDVDFIPIKLVYIDGKFKGYVYKDIKGYFPIDGFEQKKNEKVEILLKVKDKLAQLHELGIIHGDLHQQNILYNGEDILICDLDNASVNGLDIDKKNNHVICYMDRMRELDTKLDNFLLNIVTISYYQNISYNYVLEYLSTIGKLAYRFNTPKNKEIIQEMVCLKYNYSGDLLIDNPRKKLTLK